MHISKFFIHFNRSVRCSILLPNTEILKNPGQDIVAGNFADNLFHSGAGLFKEESPKLRSCET